MYYVEPIVTDIHDHQFLKTKPCRSKQSSLLRAVFFRCWYGVKPICCLMSLKNDCLGLLLDRLPIIFPSKMFVTKSLCFSRCPMSFISLFIIAVMMFLSSPISCKMVSFLFLSVKLVLVILLQIHISIASNLSFSSYKQNKWNAY